MSFGSNADKRQMTFCLCQNLSLYIYPLEEHHHLWCCRTISQFKNVRSLVCLKLIADFPSLKKQLCSKTIRQSLSRVWPDLVQFSWLNRWPSAGQGGKERDHTGELLTIWVPSHTVVASLPIPQFNGALMDLGWSVMFVALTDLCVKMNG